MGQPARNYSWAPFAKGHTLSLKYGAHSPRTYGPLADELAQHLLAERDDLQGYALAVQMWAVATTKWLLVERYLDEVGLFDHDGAPREGLINLSQKLASAALRTAQVIGLTPKEHAQLASARVDATKSTLSLDEQLAKLPPTRAQLEYEQDLARVIESERTQLEAARQEGDQ